MNFYLKVHKSMESESERNFWQKVLLAAVDEPETLEGDESALDRIARFDVVDVTESSESPNGVVTKFCYRTEINVSGLYEDFLNNVGWAIYRFVQSKNVAVKLSVHIWWDDREPDAIVERTLADMAGETNRMAERYAMTYQPPGESSKTVFFQAEKQPCLDDAFQRAAYHPARKVLDLNGEYYLMGHLAFQTVVDSGCAGAVLTGSVGSEEMYREPFNEGGFASTVAACRDGKCSQAVDGAQEPRDEASRPSSGPNNIYGLRYANYCPNDRHAVDKTYAILAETWLERLQGDFHGREPNDWVRYNREIMSAFEHSVAKNEPDFSLFEAVQYPCERCATTVALRAAHLVSLDSNGCPNHDGFPEYLCAACAKEAIKEEE